MEGICQNKNDPIHRTQVYICFIESVHMVREKTGKIFNKSEYYKHPENFEPIFHEKYLPYISAIFHNMYWDYRFPRLITEE